MDVTRVPVTAATRSPDGQTAAYLLGSDGALLVDPAARSDDLDRAVEETGVDHVAVTHHHPDHVGAVAEYAGRCDATVWARRAHADDFGTVTGVAPDRTVQPGDAIPAGDGRVTVLDTPGHAPEHVAFRWQDGALVGDLAVAAGSVVVGGPDGDMRAYLTSLRRVRASGLDTLYPAHGPVVEDPRETLERLLTHRLDRERRVHDAVQGGARTVDDVLEGAYDKDLVGVRELARATVVCHLEKLAVEGRVAMDDDRVRPA
jgi:glyoxylase-like metal-dependent hydrolase (beta-lactamase superfamily II)